MGENTRGRSINGRKCKARKPPQGPVTRKISDQGKAGFGGVEVPDEKVGVYFFHDLLGRPIFQCGLRSIEGGDSWPGQIIFLRMAVAGRDSKMCAALIQIIVRNVKATQILQADHSWELCKLVVVSSVSLLLWYLFSRNSALRTQRCFREIAHTKMLSRNLMFRCI